MDMRKLVGRNVRKARKEAGLTQERLAEKSGLTQQYISDLERGTQNPTVITLYELAMVLEVMPSDLILAEKARRTR
jgi:transcriptional regulator with XRE-family HTH domain